MTIENNVGMAIRKKNRARRRPDLILPIPYKVSFKATIEYEGKVHGIRPIDISKHGVLIPRRIVPPPEGTHVKVCLTVRDETSAFEGVVKRITKCLSRGIETVEVWMEFPSPEYQNFLKDKISIT